MSSPKQANPREVALEILTRVETRHAYADVLLDARLREKKLSRADGSLLTELVYGTLRWRGRIDFVLADFLAKPLEGLDPATKNLLRLSLYQLLFLDRVPAYAVVNEGVSLARKHAGQGKGRLVNGVLRNFLRGDVPSLLEGISDGDPDSLAAFWSHPIWLCKLWQKKFGLEDLGRLLQANNEPAPLVLRYNRRKTSREDLLRRFLDAGIGAAPGKWSPDAVRLERSFAVRDLPGFADGLFQVQGEASQLVGYLVGPEPGMRVLDACAAPGGKATHLAELMNDTGDVAATDISARGVVKIVESARRLGLDSVRAYRADLTQGLAEGEESFDCILVDAPCSGLGTLRSHPEIKWRRSEDDIPRLSLLQTRILEGVASLLKSEGVLVYATCTLSREENEEVVENFLTRHPEFSLEEAKEHLPKEAKEMVSGPYFLALPHVHDTDGFFAARLRRWK